MNEYKPIESIEEVKEETILTKKPIRKSYLFNKDIPKDLTRVIKSEKSIKRFNITFSFFLFLFSILFILFTIFKWPPFHTETGSTVLYGYTTLFSFIAFGSLVSMISNIIELSQWVGIVKKYEDGIEKGDKTAANNFHITYRKIALKGVNLMWITIFILTYMGIITGIIYGLYKAEMWSVGEEENVVRVKFDWKEILDNAFGNTIWFCIIMLSGMGVIFVSYIIIFLIDKKRTLDISNYLGNEIITIYEKTEKQKKDRHKLWFKAYIIIVCITIVLPLAIFLYLLYRRFIRNRFRNNNFSH